MFHNNYKIYQTNFDRYNIEIKYWNEFTQKVVYTNIDVDKEQMNKIVDLLNDLDFDDNTPAEEE